MGRERCLCETWRLEEQKRRPAKEQDVRGNERGWAKNRMWGKGVWAGQTALSGIPW